MDPLKPVQAPHPVVTEAHQSASLYPELDLYGGQQQQQQQQVYAYAHQQQHQQHQQQHQQPQQPQQPQPHAYASYSAQYPFAFSSSHYYYPVDPHASAATSSYYYPATDTTTATTTTTTNTTTAATTSQHYAPTSTLSHSAAEPPTLSLDDLEAMVQSKLAVSQPSHSVSSASSSPAASSSSMHYAYPTLAPHTTHAYPSSYTPPPTAVTTHAYPFPYTPPPVMTYTQPSHSPHLSSATYPTLSPQAGPPPPQAGPPPPPPAQSRGTELLLVFVNSRSGGGQGAALLPRLRALVPVGSGAVIDLSAHKPEDVLPHYLAYPSLRILACGGDGTGKWILETLDRLGCSHLGNPPVATLPLGTGNDISRVLGWGPGYEGQDLAEILDLVRRAQATPLDRWKIEISETLTGPTTSLSSPSSPTSPSYTSKSFSTTSSFTSSSSISASDPSSSSFASPHSKSPVQPESADSHSHATSATDNHDKADASVQMMNNYLSVGFADAEIALDFHQRREDNPNLFSSRGVNKLWYAAYGAKNALKGIVTHVPDMHTVFDLYVDGNKIDIPVGLKGLVVLNLPTYAGGMNLWGTTKDARFYVPSMADGLLEVIGMKSAAHFARVKAGLTFGVRVAQGRHIVLHYRIGRIPLPAKIDGEPWLQQKSATFNITFEKQSYMLARALSAGSVSYPEKIGWLQQHVGGLKAWLKRYVILKNRQLLVFNDPQDKRPALVIPLVSPHGYPLMIGDASQTMKKSYCFNIVQAGKEKDYVFCAKTDVAYREWCYALHWSTRM